MMRRFARFFMLTLAITSCGRQRAPETTAAASKPMDSNEIRIDPDSPQLNRLRVEQVSNGKVPLEEVVVPGRIEADPGRISRVALPVAGRVKQVMVTLGDAVREGQPILTLDSPDVSGSLSVYRQAQARVSQAKAAQSKAEADLHRIQDLFDNRAIAQKEVINAPTALAEAKSDLAQAEASFEGSAKKLQILGVRPDQSSQYVLVRAPESGKVIDVAVSPGEYRTDTSAPVMTIADLSTVFMTADVPESQIRFIEPGEEIEIVASAYRSQRAQGKVQ